MAVPPFLCTCQGGQGTLTLAQRQHSTAHLGAYHAYVFSVYIPLPPWMVELHRESCHFPNPLTHRTELPGEAGGYVANGEPAVRLQPFVEGVNNDKECNPRANAH
ncbi:hypothetical protein D3C77_519740 [compost metagenome]